MTETRDPKRAGPHQQHGRQQEPLAVVFEGGGARGVGHAGAYLALYGTRAINKVTVAAGSSIGGLFALMTCMRLPPEMVHEQATCLDMFRFLTPDAASATSDGSLTPALGVKEVYKFLRDYGVYQPGYLAEYVRRFLAVAWKKQTRGRTTGNWRPSHQCICSRHHPQHSAATRASSAYQMPSPFFASTSGASTVPGAAAFPGPLPEQRDDDTEGCPRKSSRSSSSAEPYGYQCEYCSICLQHCFPWATPELQVSHCDGDPTLGDIHRLFGVDIVITVTVSGMPYYLTSRTHPTMPAFFAATSGMCLPLLFAPVAYRGAYLTDGGVTDNMPVGFVRKHFLGTDFSHRVLSFGFTINFDEQSPFASMTDEATPVFANNTNGYNNDQTPVSHTPLPASMPPGGNHGNIHLRVPISANSGPTMTPIAVAAPINLPHVDYRAHTPANVSGYSNVSRDNSLDGSSANGGSHSSGTYSASGQFPGKREKSCINIVTNTMLGMAKFRGAHWIQLNYGITIPGLILLDTPGIESTTLVTTTAQKEECISQSYLYVSRLLVSKEFASRWV